MADPLRPIERAYYLPEPAYICAIEKPTDTERILTIRKHQGFMDFSPGQFVQISVPGIGEAPFSVCSSPQKKEAFEICVRAVGQVSDALHRLTTGDVIGVRGPYGSGFPLAKMKDNDLLCIAGGIGIAPLRPVISYARENRINFGRLNVIYGAKTPSLLLFKDDLARWNADIGMRLYLIVDDPDEKWEGPIGVLTDPLKKMDINPEKTVAAVVGPPVVFRFVAVELLEKKMPSEKIYFSLERRFQCGIGKCGHCQLNDLYVCQDGPVFTYAQLSDRTEAVEARMPETE